jgi:hypothetical protein
MEERKKHTGSSFPSHRARGAAMDERKKHWADREYTPIEAAYAIQQYMKLDPSMYLKQCDLVGVDVRTDGKLIKHYSAAGFGDQEDFLVMWMKLSGMGKALRSYLKKRGRVDTVEDFLQVAKAA